MKKLFVILALFLPVFAAVTYSQSAEETAPVYTHTVYRHDGSVLKGEITEWNTQYMKLKLLSGLEIVLTADEVQKVVSKNVPRTKTARTSVAREYKFKDEGLYHVTSTSFSAGPFWGVGITHAVGYRFSRPLSVGAGIGAETFDIGSGKQMIPVFAEVRGFLMKQNISPYYAVRAGYGFAFMNEEENVTSAKGGRMLSAELGYRFTGDRAFNVFAGVGVHFQKATYTYQWPWSERITDEISHQRTELKVGVIF